MWDFISLIRDQTCVPSLERQILNQWTIKEFLYYFFFFSALTSCFTFAFNSYSCSHFLKENDGSYPLFHSLRFIPPYHVRSRQLTQGCLLARKSLVACFKVKRAIQAKQDWVLLLSPRPSLKRGIYFPG